MNDLISIIVPIYNVEMFLDKCIKSLLAQTYKNIEIILVNDGSTDRSKNICEKYKNNSKIKIINKNNGGVSSARNVGIKKAQGKYICFLDGDDYVAKNYIEYLYHLIKNSGAEISCSAEMFTSFNTNQFLSKKEKIVTGTMATKMILCYRLPIGANAKMFSKDFLDKYNIKFSQNLIIGEGFNFNTKAFQYAKKVAIGYQKIYFYRKNNPNSVTTLYNNQKWENGIYAIEKIREDFIIDYEYIKNSWNYAYWRTKTDVYDLIILAKVKDKYPNMYKKCTKNIRRGFILSLKCPVSLKDRLRAFVFMIEPKLIPFAMKIRRRIYNIKF